MLTPDDLKALQRPFSRDDHSFRKAGQDELVYVEEDTVSARLDDVDPNWRFEIIAVERSSEKQVVVHARLTIKDVTRDGVGMQQVDDKFGEAEKGAATDALKRCARLFGVGRYLLGAPRNKAEFYPWLSRLQRESGMAQDSPPVPASSPTKPATQRSGTAATQQPATPKTARSGAEDPLLNTAAEMGATVRPANLKGPYWDGIFTQVRDLMPEGSEAGQRAHFREVANKLRRENIINDAMTDEKIVEIMRANRSWRAIEKDAAKQTA